jgi:hypothetical protein
MVTIYHVTRGWDGGDLRSLARRVDDGDLGLDEALEQVAARWCDGCLATAERYLDGDGHEVHCHATLAEAIAYRDEWCDGGEVLSIDAAGLVVAEGCEYPHPVVRDLIPADAITVVEVEVA